MNQPWQDPGNSDRKLDAFQPLRQRRAADEVVMVLADAISGGLYSSGDLLPRERDLAKRLEVSRTVVREAIGVLRRANVVTAIRGQGTTVTSAKALPDVVANLRGETHDTLKSLLEARRALEIPAAILAGERATQNDMDYLNEQVDGLPSLLEAPGEFQALDFRFHLAIAGISQSPVLRELLDTVIARLGRMLSRLPVGRVDLSRALENQRATFTALTRREPTEIATSIDDHLAALEEQVLGARLLAPIVPQPAERAAT